MVTAAAPQEAEPQPEADPEAPPEYIVCPLTFEVFVDPVMAADGFTYERELILEYWAKAGVRSPMTSAKLASNQLFRNQAVRDAVVIYQTKMGAKK